MFKCRKRYPRVTSVDFVEDIALYQPCDSYEDYKIHGELRPGMSLREIFNTGGISWDDKAWLFKVLEMYTLEEGDWSCPFIDLVYYLEDYEEWMEEREEEI